MPRKERCPKCGSKKIKALASSKKCTVCGHAWSGRERTIHVQKDKVRKDVNKKVVNNKRDVESQNKVDVRREKNNKTNKTDVQKKKVFKSESTR